MPTELFALAVTVQRPLLSDVQDIEEKVTAGPDAGAVKDTDVPGTGLLLASRTSTWSGEEKPLPTSVFWLLPEDTVREAGGNWMTYEAAAMAES